MNQINSYINIWKNINNFNSIYNIKINKNQKNEIIKWIFEICYVYELSIETFETSILLLYENLSKNHFSISKLQLLASICILISSKFNDKNFPSINEFVFLCDGLYKKEEFIEFEILICNQINWKIKNSLIRSKIYFEIFENEIDEEFEQSINLILKKIFENPKFFKYSDIEISKTILNIILNGFLKENLTQLEKLLFKKILPK